MAVAHSLGAAARNFAAGSPVAVVRKLVADHRPAAVVARLDPVLAVHSLLTGRMLVEAEPDHLMVADKLRLHRLAAVARYPSRLYL